MIILNKKQILLLVVIFILSIFLLIITMRRRNKESISTVGLPVTAKTVVLDAGHGYPDEGAILLHKENKQLTFYK